MFVQMMCVFILMPDVDSCTRSRPLVIGSKMHMNTRCGQGLTVSLVVVIWVTHDVRQLQRLKINKQMINKASTTAEESQSLIDITDAHTFFYLFFLFFFYTSTPLGESLPYVFE